MAGETLRDGADLLAQFPDNASGLITAVASRDAIVSQAPSLGFAEDAQASFGISITDGVWVSVNQAIIPTPNVGARFWQLDGNQAWIPDYGAVVVPSGLERVVSIRTVMVLSKAGGGEDDYLFQYFQAGAPIGIAVERTFSGSDNFAVVDEQLLYDVSDGDALDLRVQGDGTGDDLTVTDYRQTIQGWFI